MVLKAPGDGKIIRSFTAEGLTFWIKDPAQSGPPLMSYTQPLWPNQKAVGNLGLFSQALFTLPSTKKYGSESGFSAEPNLSRVSWNTANDRYRLSMRRR